jgi:hypothetical protein
MLCILENLGAKKRKVYFYFYFFVFLKFIKLFLLDGFFKHCSYKVLSGGEC